MLYQKIDTTQGLTSKGLIPIPQPMPIPQPIPIPAPTPIQPPEPLPRSSVLPGTSTLEQYYSSQEVIAPAAVTGEISMLSQGGTPAIGQYLIRRGRPSPEERAAARAAGTTRALTAPTAPPVTAATSQINLPGPGRFWRGTAASRQVTIPAPEEIWRGAPTTNQISLPPPEEFWRK